MTAGPTATTAIGIVVVNYGSHALLAENLGDPALRQADARVVVVDNFSDATERSRVEQLADEHGWQLVASPTNVGFGAGVNVGLRAAAAAGCETFLLLNPDVRLSVAVLTELHDHLLRDPMALVTPRLETPDGRIAFQGSQLFLDTGRIKGLPAPAEPEARGPKGDEISARPLGGGRPAAAWLPATCLAVHRDLLIRSGGFDEPYFLYWEDVDFSYRCTRAGGRLVIRHDLSAIHDEGGTQHRRSSRALSDRYYYWNCRNRLLFAARHLGRRKVGRWLVHTPAESWQILLRGGRRQLLHSPRPLWATVRGALAGAAIAVRAVLRPRPTPVPAVV